jgi:rhodanese-related sulfurtransferase
MTKWTSWTSLVVLGMAAAFAGPGLADAADPDLRQAIAAYLGEGPMESLRVQPAALEDDPREDFYFVLDVRTPSDFAAGHIQGAVNVPYTELLAHLDRLPADLDQAILTYCEHATRSTQALMALRLLGYRNVWYLNGGLDRWRQEGRPLGTAGQ